MSARLRRRERGIALVLVLWITVLLTVIAGTFAFDMRTEALGARNALSLAQAQAIADGAIERFVFELLRPRPQDAWKADGRPHAWTDGEARVTASAVDEAARVDLNAATDAMLKTLLINVGGADPATANALVDAIADWRDPDDLRRPNGAEEADYRAANAKYKPANAPFDSVADLARVLGMTSEIYTRVAPALTVYSRVPGVNVYTAPRSVLLSIPNVLPEQVDAYLRQREAALEANLPPPPFPWAQNYATAPAPVNRIRAEVTMPDGVTFVREAVVRSSPDPRRPLTVLAWTQGPRAPAAPPAGAPATAQVPNPPADAARS